MAFRIRRIIGAPVAALGYALAAPGAFIVFLGEMISGSKYRFPLEAEREDRSHPSGP